MTLFVDDFVLFQTQEDMAMQIAMMIVNEVNQATAQKTPGDLDT